MPTRRVVVLDHTAELGGAEIALDRLLGAIDRAHWDPRVVVFADGPLVARLDRCGVPVRVVELSAEIATRERSALVRRPARMIADATRLAGFALRLARVIDAADADLVVANSLKSAVIGAAAARLSGRPFVWHLHDRLSDDYLPGAVARAMRTLARRAPGRLVVNSRATLASLEPIDPTRTVLAYPGLPSAYFDGPEHLPSEPPVIGMIGRISPTKGQDVFLQAAGMLSDHPRRPRFRIAGRALFNEQSYEESVRALAAETGLGDRVELAGWVEDSRAALQGFDVVVHASPVPEPFGQVIVEAMAAGIPVIGSDSGGVVEVLDPAGGPSGAPLRRTSLGQLVRPRDARALRDAISWVLDHPDEAAQTAGRARASARERFTIDRTARVVESAWSAAHRESRRS